MRKTVLTSLAAAVVAVGFAARVAQGASEWSPWTVWMAPWNWAADKWDEATRDEPSAPVVRPAVKQSQPSAQISPLRHPVKYFGAAMSETPLASTMGLGQGDKSAERKIATKHDSLSLSTPTGPPSQQLYVAMAEMSERQGNMDLARQQLDQALGMWPGNVEVLRAAARLEDRQGQLLQAENLYRQAIAANPQHAGAHNDLGLCLARQAKLGPSIQEFEQAIHLQPDKALYRNNVATVLVEMGQDQMALAHLAAVHGPAEANFNLGQLLAQRGRSPEALPYFQAALAQKPTLTQAQAAITRIQGSMPAVAPPSPVAALQQAPGVPMAPQVPQTQLPQSSYPANVSSSAGNPPAYVPPTYGSPAAAPAATDYRASLPRHLPPVAAPAGQWTR